MFRILLVVSTIVGFILCFLSMALPYWVNFETATYSGQIGVFLLCINQHEDGVSCSRIVKDSYIVDGSYKIPQVFMGLGFSFYLISVFLATMTFFWTRDLKKIRGIKFAAASFAFLTAICLVVAVVVFHNMYDKETETITYGWYIAVISLSCVTLACPCYIIDGCRTNKQKDEKVPKTNTAPSPTALTVYRRQKLKDGFNDQILEQQSQLPEPLCFEDKYAILSDETNIEHDSDNDTNELKSTTTLKQPMVVPPSSEFSTKASDDYECNDDNFIHPPPKIVSSDPPSSEFSIKASDDYGCNEDNFIHPPPKIVSSDPPSSEFSFKKIGDYGCNDDNFVHPAPKIVSADTNTPFKDILLKNLQPHSGNDRDISRTFSCYSLESGQTDDSDLEFHLLTKGTRSNKVIDEDRPPSREAFDERKIVDGQIVTEIRHDELATTDIFGSNKELSEFKEPNHLYESSNALQIEEIVEIHSEPSNALPIEEVVEIHAEPSNALPIEEVVEIHAEPSNALPIEEVEVRQSETSNALPIKEVEVRQSETSNALPIEEVEVRQSETSNALPIKEVEVRQSDTSNALPIQEVETSNALSIKEVEVRQPETSNALPIEEVEVRQSDSSNALPIKEVEERQSEAVNALPIEEVEVRQSEAVNDNNTQYTVKSAPKRSSRRYKSEHNNQASAKSNSKIFRAQYGTSSPYTKNLDLPKEKGKYDDKRQKPEKKSSKRMKQNSTQHGKTKRKLGDSRVAHKDSNAAKEEIPNKATVKSMFGYCNGDGVFTQFLKENAPSSDLVADTFDENHSGNRKHKNENQLGEQSEKEADGSVSCKDLNTIKEEIPIEAKTKSVVGKREFLY
ncbi:uncharacterized protein LOC134708524 [Mytilus trossulus]|uniref:uncharacterized protein LOC134708524 n=1 Tax=Mytilus trossulus TaxID=6551 RepID=UPI003003ABF8